MSEPNPNPTRKERRAAAREARIAAEQAEAAKARRQRRLSMLGGIVLVAAVIVVAAVLITGGDSAPKKKAGEKVAGQQLAAEMVDGIPQKGLTLGDPKAPVTILELADLKCPVCKHFEEETLPRIVQDYVRTGKAKIEFHPFTVIDDQSNSAWRWAAGAAQQNKLWNYTKIVYFNQGNETTGWATDEKMKELAAGVPGLDIAKMEAYAKTPQAAQPLQVANTLASRYGATGTPTIVVGPTGGNLKNTGGFDFDTVSNAIKDALKA
jgi:protein-disulfide isomerase